ncbi:MAG: DUF262 domain-containing protein [Actinomycetota bacterium]|nr:DUF262 domain-containing protein [Actinomycetota bacterium]
MKIELTSVSIRELATEYVDNQEDGVVGYGGKLDIRPPYQREFVYKDKQRDAVVDTVFKTYPLNVFYWAVRLDGGFEIIDGQQRTISVCQYVNNDFSFEGRYFNNLQDDEQEKFLNYEITVYRCSGTDSEKLAWFRTINIAGEKLTEQELRNAVYSGSWVSAAKRIFSKSNCAAYLLGSDYVDGSPIRQHYLEQVITWLSDGDIEGYMASHQHDTDASAEWDYFQKVIAWVKATFTEYRSEMKGLPWGTLYNKHKDKALDPKKVERDVAKLMEDEDVTSKKGIYAYILTGEERNLNIRTFDKKQKREAYERQKGICVKCKKKFTIEEMEADHITPWSKGGPTEADNCQLLCIEDNRRKGGK